MGTEPHIGTRRTQRRRTLVLLVPVLLLTGCALAYWPVEGPLTSPWGLRFRGIRPEIHRGVDIRVPVGTPVLAMRGGTVAHAGPLGDFGLAVLIDHDRTTRTVYGHLSAVEVATGDRVEGRQRIGLSGQTGNATGAHLHFEVLQRGHSVDPVPLLGGRPGETGTPDRP